MHRTEPGAARVRDVDKASAPIIPAEGRRLQERLRAGLIADMAADHKQIEPAVPVEIPQPGPELHLRSTDPGQPEGRRRVLKLPLSLIEVQRVVLHLKVRDPQVDPPVAVHIAAVDPHAPFGVPQFIKRHSGQGPHLAQLLPVRAQIEVILDHIVGDVEIDPLVFVQIGCDHPQPHAVLANARRVRDLDKPSVRRVEKEVVPCRMVILWRRDFWMPHRGRHPVDIPRHIQVQLPIAVHIAKGCSRVPSRYAPQASLGGDIQERPIALIEEQAVLPVTGHQHIRKSIAVDIAADAPMRIVGGGIEL